MPDEPVEVHDNSNEFQEAEEGLLGLLLCSAK